MEKPADRKLEQFRSLNKTQEHQETVSPSAAEKTPSKELPAQNTELLQEARRQLKEVVKNTETKETKHQTTNDNQLPGTDVSYKYMITNIQRRLTRTERIFSKFIHQPIVEKASNSMEKTVARPYALLGAGIGSFVGLLVMVYFANRNGFSLSGSEYFLFALGGWTIGLIVEFVSLKNKVR